MGKRLSRNHHMSRVSLKVTGAQGQGVNSVGEICGKGLKRAGYCVFGYREYMSLIKGGHSSYQLDASHEKIESSETRCDIVVNFNHYGLEENYADVKDGGVLIHQTPDWEFPKDHQKLLDERNITVVFLPTEDILKKMNAPPILGNVLITSVVWSLLGQSDEGLKELVREQFGHKGEELVQKNFTCIDEGVAFAKGCAASSVELPKADPIWKDHLFMTGSEAMGLGIVHAGCRMYVGYPMTPSSPMLTYLANIQNDTGMIIKQAEDEITAAQMMTGAMLMGTRAATGTSGGGFDLMTETVSLNGIIENPSVFVLAQRPGPATGLPTWSGQGDLLLAVNSAHGEFARLVMSVSDSQDAFDLMPKAFNYADEYQTPVIVLTDKHIAEALYTQPPFDEKKAKISRGNLVTDPKKLAKLKSHDRFDPSAKDGISPRWLPGAKAATYCAQGDEHDGAGNVEEGAENAKAQMLKRMKKMVALKQSLPAPELFGNKDADTLIVSWGSNKGVILDAIKEQPSIAYLHYTYLWPLKTELLEELAGKAKKTILIEQNYQGQLGMLVKQECGLEFDETMLKYDGRPFFIDELQASLSVA